MSPAGADGIIIVDPPPGVNVRLDQSLAIKYHHVDIQIKEQVATTHVDQAFINDQPWTAEGTYISPLPEGAVVSDLVMWVDGTAVHGEILEADEAREVRPMRQCLRRVQILDIEDEGAAGRGPIPPNPADPGSYSSISPLA